MTNSGHIHTSEYRTRASRIRISQRLEGSSTRCTSTSLTILDLSWNGTLQSKWGPEQLRAAMKSSRNAGSTSRKLRPIFLLSTQFDVAGYVRAGVPESTPETTDIYWIHMSQTTISFSSNRRFCDPGARVRRQQPSINHRGVRTYVSQIRNLKDTSNPMARKTFATIWGALF